MARFGGGWEEVLWGNDEKLRGETHQLRRPEVPRAEEHSLDENFGVGDDWNGKKLESSNEGVMWKDSPPKFVLKSTNGALSRIQLPRVSSNEITRVVIYVRVYWCQVTKVSACIQWNP